MTARPFGGLIGGLASQKAPMLTTVKIKTAKPQERPYKLADSGGLYLLVQPNGSKL